MVKKVIERFGHIDVLYNNAGVNHFGKIVDVKEEDWDRVMTVNVKSVYLTCKYVIPHMQKAGKGTIINTASQLHSSGCATFPLIPPPRGPFFS